MKFIARKPVVRTEVYRKYGFTYVEHKPCYCPRCNHVLNAGPKRSIRGMQARLIHVHQELH